MRKWIAGQERERERERERDRERESICRGVKIYISLSDEEAIMLTNQTEKDCWPASTWAHPPLPSPLSLNDNGWGGNGLAEFLGGNLFC